LRNLERSIEPLEGLAPQFAGEVELAVRADLAFVLRDLHRAAAGARALLLNTDAPESEDEGTQLVAPPPPQRALDETQVDDAAPTVPYESQARPRDDDETQTQLPGAPSSQDGVAVGSRVEKYFRREGRCHGTVKSMGRVVVSWEDGTFTDHPRADVQKMLVSDRPIEPFEGDHPSKPGRRKRRASAQTSKPDLGRGRRAKGGARRFVELVDGGKTYKPESPAKRAPPQKTCSACHAKVHARKANCAYGHAFGAKKDPAPAEARPGAPLPSLAEDVSSLIARDAPIQRTCKHRAPRYERYTTATTAREYLSMGGAKKDLKYDLDSGFVRVTDRGPPVEDSSSEEEEEFPNKPRDPLGAADVPPLCTHEAPADVDMEPVTARALDADKGKRALWPFKPTSRAPEWKNSCSASTGDHADTQYDEQPKRHDKRKYARLAPREALDAVPEEQASSPEPAEAPQTPQSSPRRSEGEEGGATAEAPRRDDEDGATGWVGNSLDLTCEDSQDDGGPPRPPSPDATADETRLSEASRPAKGSETSDSWDESQAPRTKASPAFKLPTDDDDAAAPAPPRPAFTSPQQREGRWLVVRGAAAGGDDAQPPDAAPPPRPPRPPFIAPPARQTYTVPSPTAAPRDDESPAAAPHDDATDDEDDDPPAKRRKAAEDTDTEAPQRVVDLCAGMGVSVSRAQATKAQTRGGDMENAVSLLVENETRGIGNRAPRSRARGRRDHLCEASQHGGARLMNSTCREHLEVGLAHEALEEGRLAAVELVQAGRLQHRGRSALRRGLPGRLPGVDLSQRRPHRRLGPGPLLARQPLPRSTDFGVDIIYGDVHVVRLPQVQRSRGDGAVDRARRAG